MSDQEQQQWADKAGKDIEEANKKMKEIMEDMRLHPEKYNKTSSELKITRENQDDNRIRWFNGGKF